MLDRPHEPHEFLINDLDDLLARVDAGQHLLPDGLLGDALDKSVDDVEIDVAFDDIGASKQDRLGSATSHVQIGVSGKTHDCGLHLQLRRGNDVDVQPDSIQ